MLYKVLVDGRSCFGGRLAWSLPTRRPGGGWEPGAWEEVAGPIELCRRGIHLTTRPFERWTIWGMEVFEAEASEIVAHDRDKAVAARARLLRPEPPPPWWSEAVRLIESELATARWFRPDGEPLPDWRVVTVPAWDEAYEACTAARDAAERAAPPTDDRELEWQADVAAAIEATDRSIPWQVAAGVARWRARKVAVRGALRAEDADGYAPIEAANDAAEFFAGYVQVLGICADQPVAPGYRALIDKMWTAYRKGYVPYGYGAGHLFVAAVERRRRSRSNGPASGEQGRDG